MHVEKVILVFVTLTVSSQGFLFKSKVCYGKYGCFSRQPGLNRLLVALPKDPSAVGTTFHMFTRRGSGIVDDYDKRKLMKPKFDISRRTIFVIHGWRESALGSAGTWSVRMKDVILRREDCNVVLVDWSKGSRELYRQSAGNTRLVGAQVAELIRFLISSASGSHAFAQRFYIVGFSLGAQTAGYAGTYLKDRGMTLGRITGLDPAGPYFINVRDARFRLDRSDAEYVDVIHTDMPSRSTIFGLGTPEKAGHTDFFPNGGSTQPGCARHLVKLDLFRTVICDHVRAPQYYIASVQNRCSWKAYPCRDYSDFEKGKCRACNGECPSMGYDADKTKRSGSFYLKTSSKAPFCALN